jgi:cell division protein FtsW (lipid II flippase)
VPLPGRKKNTSAMGVFRIHILYFVLSFALLYFYLHHFIKNPKKLVYFIVAFIFLLLVFAKMSNPEVEVRSFKQQGGESLKDAWYRINNAHRRCTKKHSTTILLRNFYVGISS